MRNTDIGLALTFMGAILLILALTDAPAWSVAIIGGGAMIRGVALVWSARP